MKNTRTILAATAALILPTQAALYSFQSGASLVPGNSLTGTVTYEGWDNLTTSRINNSPLTAGNNATRPYSYHNLTNGWSESIPSNLGDGPSTLFKSSGLGYIASGSLHQGLSSNEVIAGGNFSVTSSAILGTETFIFLIQASTNGGQVFDSLPTLTIGSTTLPANYFSGVYESTPLVPGPGGQQYNNSYAFQWDLRGLSINEGESLITQWTGISNSGIYQLQIHQGTTFAQVVPEPSSALLGATVLSLTLIRRRRA
jgi:hypothetical protein